MKIKIVIFEMHKMFTEVISQKLNATQEFKVIACFTQRHTFFKAIAHLASEIDVIIINPDLSTGFDFKIIEILKLGHPNLKQIIFSYTMNDMFLTKLVLMGIFAYAPKNISFNAFKEIIFKTHFASSPIVLKQHIKNYRKYEDIILTIDHLNVKEQLFIQYCATEMTYKEIAAKLLSSIKSMEATRDKLYRKFNVNSRATFVLICKKYQLL